MDRLRSVIDEERLRSGHAAAVAARGRVGGIQDQIRHEHDGLLVDPAYLAGSPPSSTDCSPTPPSLSAWARPHLERVASDHAASGTVEDISAPVPGERADEHDGIDRSRDGSIPGGRRDPGAMRVGDHDDRWCELAQLQPERHRHSSRGRRESSAC
jgi:hypothetical protein